MEQQENPGTAASVTPRFFYGYVIVMACFLIMVVLWGTFNSFGIFYDSLIVEFGWTRTMTAGAFSLNNLLIGLFCILIARLCDQYSPRIVINTSSCILGLGYLLMSGVTSIWQFYFFYGVMIAVGMGAYVAILPIVARWFTGRRGLMTGIVFSGMGLGTMVIPPAANRLISTYGWRHSFIIVGVIALIILVLASQFLKPDPRRIGQLPYGEEGIPSLNTVQEAHGATFREALCSGSFWLLAAMYFILLTCTIFIMAHVFIHATGVGVSPACAANILVILGLFSIVGMNIMGMAGDRFGNRAAFTIGFFLMTIAFVCLLILNDAAWVLYLFGVVFGFAYGGTMALFSPTVAELFGLKSQGVILATAACLGGIGAAIGPVMGGHIFDVTGKYTPAFLICAVIAAIGLILSRILKSRETPCC